MKHLPWIIGLIVWSLLCAPVRAEPTPSEKTSSDKAMATEREVCSVVCARRFQACSKADGQTAPTCNTGYVGCVIGCDGCLPGFGSCVATGATPQSCQGGFIACLKTALANQSKARPLIAFEGGDGSAKDKAVVIAGAQNEAEGIVAENLWAGKTHPTWRKTGQALLNSGSESFDRIDYTASDGRHEAWFDITGFFGKM